MVLPVGCASAWPAQRTERHPGTPREPPRRRDARSPSAHEPLRLVKPDRHLGAKPQDERACCARLRLRKRTRTRVLGVADPANRVPLGRKVPIEVDTVRVLPRAGRVAVGIEVANEPEVEARMRALEV